MNPQNSRVVYSHPHPAPFYTRNVFWMAFILICSFIQPTPARASVDSFTVAQANPTTLDPANTIEADTFRVSGQIYDTLVSIQPGGSLPMPGLAQSWSASADGKTWTFNLRPGLKFHDGTNLDAAAVKFNIERWWDPAHPFHSGEFTYFESIFGGFKGDPDSLITSVAANGATKVVISLKEPTSSLPSRLAIPAFGIASPTAIQSGNLSTHPVGSGPYRFIEWQASLIHLEANPSYWGEAALFQDLYFRLISSEPDRLAALKAGQADFADGLGDDILTLALKEPGLAVYWRPSNGTGYLGINTGYTPLDKLLVRQAIAYAINIPLLLENFYTMGDQPATQFLPPVVWGRDPELAARGYNPELARSLLAEAGYPQGFSINFYYRNVYRTYLPEPSMVAQVIQAMLAEVEIQANIVQLESGEFLTRLEAGTLEMFLFGWIADYPHPENFFNPILCSGILSFGPQDDTLCNLVQTAEQKTDIEDQISLYQQASQRVHDTLPLVPLAYPRNGIVMRRPYPPFLFSPLGVEHFTEDYLADSYLYLPLVTR